MPLPIVLHAQHDDLPGFKCEKLQQAKLRVYNQQQATYVMHWVG